jgi:two-component sensor histidine kinase
MYSPILPVVLVVSIVLQLISAGLGFVMIFKSGFYKPWIPLSAAILLMGIRRIISFMGMVQANYFPATALSAEIVALLISVLMVTGLYLFAPAFKLIGQNRQKELQAKDLLIRESHHHVKNDLQFLNSIVGLQKHSTDSEHERNNLDDLGLRIQSFSLIHEYLYNLGSMGLPSRLFFSDLVKKVSDVYDPGEGRVKVLMDIDDLQLHHKDLQYCGLLVNEALTNSYKYAFKAVADPLIQLSLKAQDGYIQLSILDNGSGLPEAVQNGKIESFGLAMIRGITSDPGWEITIDGTKGTTIRARFPIRQVEPVRGA